jgi:epoxyqueuosine reductase
MPMHAREQIRDWALAEGFDAVGFSAAALDARVGEALRAYLSEGRHGDMGWLEARADQRENPQALWPEAKSAVVLALNYAPAFDPLANLDEKTRATISAYAKGGDYHDVIKKRLKKIARTMVDRLGGDVKVFVDTAPVMEKPLAQEAGLGWQGKHTNLVSRDHGSWLFLGVILTTLDLEAGRAEQDHCGTCTNCLDICPTKAFPAPYQLDARRCISYLTIEHKGPIPRDLRPFMGNRIYGCDDCLAVCPWNKFAKATREQAFLPREATTSPNLAELATLDDATFRARFAKSPIKRIGRDRFMRNVLIAIGNSGDTSLSESAKPHLTDENPIVRGAAVWALSRLLDAKTFATLAKTHASTEQDPTVRAEWQAAKED